MTKAQTEQATVGPKMAQATLDAAMELRDQCPIYGQDDLAVEIKLLRNGKAAFRVKVTPS